MSGLLSNLRHWVQQPSTLWGLSMAVGGITGTTTHVLSGEMAITLLTSAVPLLIPDNTTARSAATALIPSAVALLGKKTGKDNQSPT